MSERAEEIPDSSEVGRFRPDFFSYYRAEVAELLGQDEIGIHNPQAAQCSSADIVGAGMSSLRRENLNILLRKCVRDLNPEVDEMLEPIISMCQLQAQLRSKRVSSLASISPKDANCKEVDDDVQLLLLSDTKLVEEAVGKYSDELLCKLENMEQQLEKLLDNVMTTCRPMARGEKRDLQKSIKELPAGNLDRIAEIIRQNYLASGKDIDDEVLVNLENGDNIMVWRLYFYVEAVKNARKLAS